MSGNANAQTIISMRSQAGSGCVRLWLGTSEWGGLSDHEWCRVATVFPKVKMTGSVDGEERELGPGLTAPYHQKISNFSLLLSCRDECAAIRADSVGVLRVGILLFSNLWPMRG